MSFKGKFGGSGVGRPPQVVKTWDQVFDALQGAFWTHKGIAANCPFCHAVSDSGKMRFLVGFEDGQYRGFGCFVCQTSGGGLQGIVKLARQIGLSLSFFEMSAMSGNGQMSPFAARTISSDLKAGKQDDGRIGEGEEGAPVDWPPSWAKDSDEVFLRGLNYVESRGISDPAGLVDKYSLVFSEVVQITINGEDYVKPYPCLVAPMVGVDGEVYGWTTRYLGEPKDGDPKAIAMNGRGWRNKTMFGLRELDPSKPVAIVEGLFSAFSTPNAVAVGGKEISDGQLEALAAVGARVYVFALDPGVDKKKFANAMYRLRQKALGSAVLSVDWARFGGMDERDPNDRGLTVMRDTIARTVLDSVKKSQT